MQLKARIRNLSQKSNVETEVILRGFMLERFLERVALSEHRHNFILKGGMLVASMVGIGARTTMDMDATIKGLTLDAPGIAAVMEKILLVPMDDGVTFSFSGIEETRAAADYPGYRVSVAAAFDKTRQTLKIDVATGDFVTPKEVEYRFPLMFEDRAICVMAYNVETILAEKAETVLTRGVANTRMRDFYDIYILTGTQAFDADVFRAALRRTAENRGSIGQMRDVRGIMAAIAENRGMMELWAKYSRKYSYATGIDWEEVMRSVKVLFVHGNGAGE